MRILLVAHGTVDATRDVSTLVAFASWTPTLICHEAIGTLSVTPYDVTLCGGGRHLALACWTPTLICHKPVLALSVTLHSITWAGSGGAVVAIAQLASGLGVHHKSAALAVEVALVNLRAHGCGCVCSSAVESRACDLASTAHVVAHEWLANLCFRTLFWTRVGETLARGAAVGVLHAAKGADVLALRTCGPVAALACHASIAVCHISGRARLNTSHSRTRLLALAQCTPRIDVCLKAVGAEEAAWHLVAWLAGARLTARRVTQIPTWTLISAGWWNVTHNGGVSSLGWLHGGWDCALRNTLIAAAASARAACGLAHLSFLAWQRAADIRNTLADGTSLVVDLKAVQAVYGA